MLAAMLGVAIALATGTPRASVTQAVARAVDQAREDASAWRRLRQELRQAAQAHAFTLAYQPRVNLADGQLYGVEAQLRWPRRRGAMSPASAFMPLLSIATCEPVEILIDSSPSTRSAPSNAAC